MLITWRGDVQFCIAKELYKRCVSPTYPAAHQPNQCDLLAHAAYALHWVLQTPIASDDLKFVWLLARQNITNHAYVQSVIELASTAPSTAPSQGGCAYSQLDPEIICSHPWGRRC